MSNAENSSQLGALRELQQARNVIDEVKVSLEAQNSLLKQRGMSLPPMVSSTINAVINDLKQMETTLLEEQTELQQLRALANLSAQITTSLDVDRVLHDAIDIIITLTRAERGYIILKNKTTDEWEFRIIHEDSLNAMQRYSESGSQPQLSQSILTHVITTGTPLLADNAFQDETLQNNLSVVALSLRSVLCVPLSYKGETIGVVYVDNRFQSGVFTDREKSMLTAFANTAAVAIANAILYHDIQELLNQITQVKVLMDNVFSSIASGVIATNAEDVVQTFNRAAERILQRDASHSVGENLGDILPKITADFADYMDKVRADSEPQIVEGELQAHDRRIVLSIKLTPLRDMDNVTQGVAVVVDDVTNRIENEQQLRVIQHYLPPELVTNIHKISRLALGGERREVTCLFVEVRPLASFKKEAPRDVMESLNSYLSVATAAIYEMQGVIDKYMGNEVMALFNTQLNPQTNHAQLGVECALKMRDGFLALYQQLGIQPEPHYYRIGMHTGICTLGNVGSLTRRDFTAIGDTINLAKRVEENSAYGQVIITEETYQHLKANSIGTLPLPYRFESRPAIQAKGKTTATTIYEVFRA